VALIQQSIVLREDTEEMEAAVDTKGGKQVIEGEVVQNKKANPNRRRKGSKVAKRRKR